MVMTLKERVKKLNDDATKIMESIIKVENCECSKDTKKHFCWEDAQIYHVDDNMICLKEDRDVWDFLKDALVDAQIDHECNVCDWPNAILLALKMCVKSPKSKIVDFTRDGRKPDDDDFEIVFDLDKNNIEAIEKRYHQKIGMTVLR